MAEGKTAALFGCACAVGARCGGAAPPVVERMDRFGRQPGWRSRGSTACWASGATRGSPATSTFGPALAQEDPSGALRALDPASVARGRFRALYGSEPLEEADLDTAAALIDRVGERERIQTTARRRLNSALPCLEQTGSAEELTALARLMVDRSI